MRDEYLKAAAEAIERQVLDHPEIGIPVDPDLADHLGAFEEEAVHEGEFDPLEEGEFHGFQL